MKKLFRRPRLWLFYTLLFMLLGLQYRIWIGEGSLAQKVELSRAVQQQKSRNDRLEERNRILAEEVEGLRNSLDAIEERARTDLGMIKKNETFFLVLDKRREPQRRPQPPAQQPRNEVEAQDVVPELFSE